MNDYSLTILQLADYEVYCNLQLIDFLARLSGDELQRDFGFGLRTPHRAIFHIANVMRTWSNCVGPIIAKPEPLPYRAEIPLADIRQMLVELGDSWLRAAQLPVPKRLGLFTCCGSDGAKRRCPCPYPKLSGACRSRRIVGPGRSALRPARQNRTRWP
jgi:hypothetical protein